MQQDYQHFSLLITDAAQQKTPLRICGSGSKDFYGLATQGEILDTRALNGIVSYEPTEMVLTARAGTPLREIEAALAAQSQMLAFEPPHFGPDATLGGCIATGLSGPRRAYTGAVRDYVLGVRMIDGKGDILRFGGEVIKNVAGYDVSRMLTASLGTLGLLLDTSLKVLPKPAAEISLRFDMTEADANTAINQWAALPMSLSASCYENGVLTIRLSGAAAALKSVRQKLGGEVVNKAEDFWHSIKEHSHSFFSSKLPLWRLSVPSTTKPLILGDGQLGDGHGDGQLIEWGGSLRWLASNAPADSIRAATKAAGGHATLFRANGSTAAPFDALTPALLAIHKRLKHSFDPHGIFNPGRIYEDL